ncbi:hypothetical protein [Pseudoroseomonas sp. WGS1072]|uniref:hypothetical protein n=1 Tax=Roseomonas sp. WGS1072 TaxID=3366816 RepID=UPI003BF0D88A
MAMPNRRRAMICAITATIALGCSVRAATHEELVDTCIARMRKSALRTNPGPAALSAGCDCVMESIQQRLRLSEEDSDAMRRLLEGERVLAAEIRNKEVPAVAGFLPMMFNRPDIQRCMAGW